MDETLIFLMHDGPVIPPHVREALTLLNDRCNFVFAGNVDPILPNAEFADTAKHTESYSYVDRHYAHDTTNPKWFEAKSIWRWFVLASEIESRRHTGAVICLDSDIFMFSDPNRIISGYHGVVGFGANQSPHICFFRSPDYVFALADLIREQLPTDGEHVKQKTGKKIIQDMTYIRYFCLSLGERGYKVSHTEQPTQDGVYDYSVAYQQPGGAYMMDDFGKVIAWRDNVPHFLSEDGSPQRALALHIQGGAKRFFHRWLPKVTAPK